MWHDMWKLLRWKYFIPKWRDSGMMKWPKHVTGMNTLQIIEVNCIAALLSIYTYKIKFSEVVNTFTLRYKCVCICCVVYWLSVVSYIKKLKQNIKAIVLALKLWLVVHEPVYFLVSWCYILIVILWYMLISDFLN